jgi:cytochrome c-type biogenesis protein CcmH
MAAASSLTPGQQDAMVKSMVDGLAARLAADPKDADGWIKLMRARMVLGQRDEAKQALASARSAFARDGAQQQRLRDAARALGVPGA